MDEFGVLVESIGFKSRRSAPMSKLKPKPNPQFNSSPNLSSFADSFDDLDGIFNSSLNIKQNQDFFGGGGDDIFGGGSNNQYGGVDFDSLLNTTSNGSNLKSASSYSYDDLLGLNAKSSDHVVDDVFGGFTANSGAKQEKKGHGAVRAIPPPPKGASPKTNLFAGSNGRKDDDPFLVFESSVKEPEASWPFVGPSGQDTSKGSVKTSLDELDKFAMGMGHKDSRTDRVRNNANKPSAGTTSNGFENVDDLDAIFGGGVQKKQAARPASTTQDTQFDIFFREEKKPEVKQTTSWSSSSKTKASPVTSIPDDFTSLFGEGATSSQEFHEIAGEPAERRRARLNRHMRMNARMAEALAEKNQRDHQSHLEQEEKDRLAESLNNDIKRWAAGKEGNLRALLSSLQQILWPECGWRPVSLTDMITSDSVKKVYKKATLYVHPDKVQQKGASLRQKYIAEKVFDLLKEAWNKFSAEELR